MSEYIPGPEKYIYTYGSVADNGDVLSEYMGRKLTQRPMRFGVAGIAESTPMIDDVRTFSKAILKASDFSGISQIEFKWDKRDGQYYLMEINPRIWLWAQTATLSGVNLVLAYYEHLTGLPITAGEQSRKGMFISGLSMFDNTVREKNLTWVKYYLKSKFVPHIFAIKDHKDKQPYKIERKRFFRKVFHLSK